MDALLMVMLGIASVVVVAGALMTRKKSDPLRLERSRRDDMAHARPVFLNHDKQWTPVTTPELGAEAPDSTTPEAAPEETTIAP